MATRKSTTAPAIQRAMDEVPQVTKVEHESGWTTTYTGTKEDILALGIFPSDGTDFFPELPKLKKFSGMDRKGRRIADHTCLGSFPYGDPNEPTFIRTRRVKGGRFEVCVTKPAYQLEAEKKAAELERYKSRTAKQWQEQQRRVLRSLLKLVETCISDRSEHNPNGYYFAGEQAATRKVREAIATLKRSEVKTSKVRAREARQLQASAHCPA